MEVILHVLFAVAGLVGGLYFMLSRDAERKQRFHVPYLVGLGVLLLTWFFASDALFAVVGVPAVAAIIWLNIRNTRFCPACGRTNYNAEWWTTQKYCSGCGAALDRAA